MSDRSYTDVVKKITFKFLLITAIKQKQSEKQRNISVYKFTRGVPTISVFFLFSFIYVWVIHVHSFSRNDWI